MEKIIFGFNLISLALIILLILGIIIFSILSGRFVDISNPIIVLIALVGTIMTLLKLWSPLLNFIANPTKIIRGREFYAVAVLISILLFVFLIALNQYSLKRLEDNKVDRVSLNFIFYLDPLQLNTVKNDATLMATLEKINNGKFDQDEGEILVRHQNSGDEFFEKNKEKLKKEIIPYWALTFVVLNKDDPKIKTSIIAGRNSANKQCIPGTNTPQRCFTSNPDDFELTRCELNAFTTPVTMLCEVQVKFPIVNTGLKTPFDFNDKAIGVNLATKYEVINNGTVTYPSAEGGTITTFDPEAKQKLDIEFTETIFALENSEILGKSSKKLSFKYSGFSEREKVKNKAFYISPGPPGPTLTIFNYIIPNDFYH